MIELLARRRVEQEKNVVITFEDSTVKNICVNNWGGNVVPGEITPAEAAAVTSLGDAFKGNSSILKFNELAYFTGLVSLKQQFYGCSHLKKVTIPAAPIADIEEAFRNCLDMKTSLDLSPITSSALNSKGALRNAAYLQTVCIPGTAYTDAQYLFNACQKLTTIEIDGTADFSQCAHVFGTPFQQCNVLTTITGSITGISYDINLSYSPLTRASALVILNGLKDGVSRIVTFKASTYDLLTSDDIAIATAKGWSVASR